MAIEQIMPSSPDVGYRVATPQPLVAPINLEDQEPQQGFWSQAWERGQVENHMLPQMARAFNADFVPDPMFEVPDAKTIEGSLKERGISAEEVPLSMWVELGGANSADQFEYRMGRIQERIESRRELQSGSGTRAFMVELASYATDPLGLMVDLAVTRGAGKGMSFSRAFMDAGVRTVAAESIIEAGLSSGGELPSLPELATGLGAAFVFGGGLGAALRPRDIAGLNEAVTDLTNPRARMRWNEATQTWDEVKPRAHYDLETGEWRSVGAAQADRMNVPSFEGNTFPALSKLLDATAHYEAHTARTAGRFDMSSWMLRSENPLIRKMGSFMFTDSVVGKGEDAIMSLEKMAKQTYGDLDGPMKQVVEGEFLKYLKRTQSNGLMNRLKSHWAFEARDRFMEAVTEYRLSKGTADAPEEVIAAAKAQNKFYADGLEAMKKANVPGAKNIEADEWYMPRVLSGKRMNRFLARFHQPEDGEAVARAAFAGAIEKARKEAGLEWDETLTKLVSKAYVRRLVGIDNSGAKPYSLGELAGFDLSDTSDLRRFLRDNEALDEDTISKADEMLDNVERLFRKSEKTTDGKGTPTILKQRLVLDDSFEFTYRDINGDEQVGRISDFFENNSETLAFNYGRQIGGEVAYARGTNGQMTSQDMVAAVEEIKKLSGLRESDPTLPSKRDAFLMEQAHRAIMGVRPDDMGENGRRILNTLKSSAFVKLMGSSAINAVSEAAIAIAAFGPGRVLRNMKEYRTLLKGLEPGSNNQGLIRQAIMLTSGVDMTFVRNLQGRAHELDTATRSKTNRFLTGIEDVVEGAKRTASYLNGLALTTDVSRRLVAASALEQLDDILVRQAKKPSWWDSRRKSWTMTDDRMNKVQAWLKSDNVERAPNGAIIDLHLEKMPTDTQYALKDYMYSITTEMIQEIDRGNLPFFMQHPMGSFAMQFRSFEMAAWVRHTLKDVAQGDVLAMTKFMSTASMASILYMGRVHLFNAFNPDRIEEEATVRNAMTTGMSYAVNVGLLPSMIDTAAQYTLGENIINRYGRRTSGLESSLGINPQSIPGYGVIKDIEQIAQIPGRLARGGAGVDTVLSKDDFRAIFGITGLKTLMPFRPFTTAVIDWADNIDQNAEADQTINLWGDKE